VVAALGLFQLVLDVERPEESVEVLPHLDAERALRRRCAPDRRHHVRVERRGTLSCFSRVLATARRTSKARDALGCFIALYGLL